MPEATFDRCYRCNYSLKGLPAAHRCPECGEAYDESVRIWRPRRRYSISAVFLLLWGFFALRAWGAVGVALASGGKPRLIDLGFGALWLAIAAGAGYTILQERRYGRLAAIMREGVFIRDRGGPGQTVPWCDIADAAVASNSVYLLHPSGGRLRRVEVDLFGEKQRDDAEAFAAAVKEAKVRFGPTAGSATPATPTAGAPSPPCA